MYDYPTGKLKWMALIDFTAKSRKFNYYTNLKDTEDTQVHKGKYDKYADLILQVVNGLILTINSLFFNLKVMVKLLNGACKKRILFFGIFIMPPVALICRISFQS